MQEGAALLALRVVQVAAWMLGALLLVVWVQVAAWRVPLVVRLAAWLLGALLLVVVVAQAAAWLVTRVTRLVPLLVTGTLLGWMWSVGQRRRCGRRGCWGRCR
jgi:hypothetical protein